MINENYRARLSAKSVIRELSEYATARGREIGYENVYDYSLGNPSVPTPKEYDNEVIRLHRELDSMSLHGYSPSLGRPDVREAIASYLKDKYGLDYTAGHIFPTSGAAGALAHALRLVSKPGDEVIGFAPYFPEYGPYVGDAGLKLSIVPAQTSDFQIDLARFEEMMNPNVAAILINSPNNPSGVVYSEDTLKALSDILTKKQEEYGHEIFLISDEPYREIVFDGKECPYPSRYYDNTLSCYSYSKSLSIPGERIGYVAVNPKAKDAELLVPIMAQISRGIGHNCPSSTAQLGVAAVLGITSDLSVYETNRNILYDKLTELGYTVVKPDGTFYIFPKALIDDSVAFCKKALEYDLVLVPADNFGCPGYFRMAYCIDTEKVKRSLQAIEKLTKAFS